MMHDYAPLLRLDHGRGPLQDLSSERQAANHFCSQDGYARRAPVHALCRGFDPVDHSPVLTPTADGIAQIGRASDPGVVAFAGAPHGHVLGELRDHSGERRIAAEAEDLADAVGFAPGHDLGTAVVAVAAHRDFTPWPVRPDTADDVLDDDANLRPAPRLARGISSPSGHSCGNFSQ